MIKNNLKQSFVCQSCGTLHPKWMGKCTDCGAWNSLEEELRQKTPHSSSGHKAHITPLSAVTLRTEDRKSTGLAELDRVLGGGLVTGSLVLLSGDPGIGKSTLLLQTLFALAREGAKVLYASGEESPSQIKLRAERLGAIHENILVTNETNVMSILEAARELRPKVLVVDSIQTVYNPGLSGAPGNITQIKECTNALMQYAKNDHVSTFVVGHVTKEGFVAGPKVLEHLVDTVLHLEGDPSSGYRILRALKNRFGSTGEIGVFAMQGYGLVDVPNPSALFLNDHKDGAEGSAITVSLEGSRPLLVELQVLVGKTSFATPRRLATGFDTNRFTILLAVLEKRANFALSSVDVYAGVTGGLKLFEPAVDLSIASAVASSLLGRPLTGKCAFFGEVGLSGEVRATSHAFVRLQEAVKLGFEKIFMPARSYKLEKEHIDRLHEKNPGSFFVVPVEHVIEVVK